MDTDDKGSASEVLSSIFGSSTQGLSLFSNNAFRRQTSAVPERGQKGSHKEHAAPAPDKVSGREPVRAPEAEGDVGLRSKNKKKNRQSAVQALAEPRSSLKELVQVQQLSGSHGEVPGKKDTPGRGSEKNNFKADKTFGKEEKGLHSLQETIRKKKSRQQQEYVELAAVQTGSKQELPHELDQVIESGVTSTENTVKRGKRISQDVFEPQRTTKRKKTMIKDASTQTSADHIKSEGGLEKIKAGTKRKKEESLEARYEKKLRGSDDSSTVREESRSASAAKDNEILNVEGITTQGQKRKRVEIDENVIEAATPGTFDEDEGLKRTIFLGNLPLTVKKKAIIREFSTYGPIESVRLRSVPLLDTKLPRKGAIIKGQINQAVGSQHGYVVFKTLSDANAALVHNMKEFSGNHVRVDSAYAPQGAGEGKSALHYDHRRSLFVGNIPFDVKDEELYKAFGVGKSPELEIEAVRVVRDPQTSLSKGIAYVLFKTNAGASFFLSPKRKVKLRDRVLRVGRVLVSQNKQKQPNLSSKHARKREEIDDSQLQRKRAKLSASYEGVRARKEPGKEKHKGTSRSVHQQHVNGSAKGRTKGPTGIAGTKRKRVEKKQRGTSRSKKIRRT